MLRHLALALFTATTALAAGCNDGKQPWRRVDHDVLVLGGGPAGLQTTMSLARLGRKVLLVDNGIYRNAATREMHDVAGLDGTPPVKYRAMARADLHEYPTITYSDATIERFENVKNGTSFTAYGTRGERFTARKVVLATGVMDELPKKKGIEEVWGTGAYWCPWCDGWEHRDGELGVLTTADLDDAIFVHELNPKQTTILTDGQKVVEKDLDKQFWPGVLKSAHAAGIKWDDRQVTRVGFVDPKDRARSAVRVWFADKKWKDFKGLLIKTTRRLHSQKMVESLGVELEGKEKLFVKVFDKDGRTSTFGVFAAGDNMQVNQNVAGALRAGKLAGMKLVEELAIEETLAAAGWDWRREQGKCR